MYVPEHFEETRVDELHRLIAEYPLGALVVNGPGGLDANHLPFELHPAAGERGRLTAHVARANPVWKEVKDGDEVLVIFRAADAYISPSWYPSKHETHRQVPTWNYQTVHVHGTIAIRDDEKFVRGVVARLTRTHEARTEPERPWKMSDSSREYIDQALTAIVGIEIAITKMVGKWKLSQNKEERDRVSAAETLGRRGERVTSAAMLKAGTARVNREPTTDN
jgi:transcriptional regulator